MAVCAYCKDSVLEEEACFCPSCDASHHQECWDANLGECCVFGCDSKPEEDVLMGCPYCEETYLSGKKKRCNICGEPLMTSREFANFLNRYDWEKLPPNGAWNPVLAAGFLRNHGIVARLSKKVPISMFGLAGGISVWVPTDQATDARDLMGSLAERFRSCDACGHALFIDEEECSFCVDGSGAKE